MNKLRFLLAFAIASICSVYSAWARTAPTLPEAQTLESGKTYYLYNVGSDRFLSYDPDGSNHYLLACTDQGRAVKISLYNGTQYVIMFADEEWYWYSYYGFIGSWSVAAWHLDTYSEHWFEIAEAQGGYTFHSVVSNQDQFVGFNGNDGLRLNYNQTEGNIVWQLMDVAEAERYVAKRNLYRALESATGYNVDRFEAVYENENSSNHALQEAADILNKAVDASNTIQKPDWSDYKILFDMDVVKPWEYYSTNNYFWSGYLLNGTSTLNATIVVDDDATLVYEYNKGYSAPTLTVYLDEELQYTIEPEEGEEQQRYFLELSPGKHYVSWQFTNTSQDQDSYCYIRNIGVEHTPTIEVSLLEPGSLGTEVLKNTDHIQNVRKLVVSGPMNSDDWERIMMMTSLFELDLTNAEITEIPERQLSRNSHSGNLSFFHKVKLPATLKSIGAYAFDYTFLDGEIVFPDGLETIGYAAFGSTRIKKAILPESVTVVGEVAFAGNESLKYVVYPASAKSIPNDCFNGCRQLQPFEIPEGIVSIGGNAFNRCYYYKTSIPSSVTSIGTRAFSNCNLDNVVIPENARVDNEAFEYSKLKTVEFPTSVFNAPSRAVKYCSQMTDIYLKSPTMVTPNDLLEGCDKNILTVHVPDYLVNTYKQDNYWYNYNIEGFSTADVDYWYIARPLALKEGERFEGNPDVKVSSYAGASLSVSGSDPMTIHNLITAVNGSVAAQKGMIISNSDNISITNQYTYDYYTEAKKWYFVCLPFDTKVGDITNDASASYAIRYYDGANRAVNGTGGNWKNYSSDDIIPAGTGFIFQTSKNTWSTFKAQNNSSMQNVFSNREFVKSLAENSSESTANKGWNLVGNPWLSYYNIHKLNFTAPITCWNVNDRNYTAYSIIDDDYAIEPGQAFFVQCPDEVNSISFPIDGRQLTSVIESQNGARATAPSERRLIDVELSDGELTDKTRFVMNPQAEMGYELNRDASKFMSMDAAVPQIYSIENGEQLAINERPLDAGSVQLGFRVSVDGEYAISAPRNSFTNIVLVDHETGMETLLANDVRYTFTASAGTNDSRFELRVGGTVVTEITNVKQDDAKANRYFNLNGQNVTTPTKGVYVVNGKKVIIK